MVQEYENKEKKMKVPVKRNNKFFSGEDFRLECEFMSEYLEQDANQTIILYEVDYENTQVNDIYNESLSNKIRFKEPVELPVVYEIKNADMKSYAKSNSKAVYSQIGNLTFSVLIKTLEENECDIHRGDYIGVQINTNHREYFTVTDDGKVNSMSNKFTLYGTEPFARTIECAPVSDVTEFNG